MHINNPTKYWRRLTAVCAMLTIWAAVAARDLGAEFVRASGVPQGSLAVLVYDLADGDTIVAVNSSAPLIPASIMKSVTTAALLQEVGPDFTYTTRVYTDGPVGKDGVLHGNLITAGSGDPALGSRVEPTGTDITAEVAQALAAAGISSVEGRLLTDESVWAGPSIPPGWAKGDLGRDYGTGTHGLNYDNNSRGSASVQDPAAVYRSRLATALGQAGITVGGKDMKGGGLRLLAEHVSPPLDEIMRSLMMRSDNMMAESMLRTYSKETGGDGSTADGAGRAAAMWASAGMPMAGVRIDDGSGLSRSNRVTADFMGSVLRHMSGDIYYASFFPLAGQEGTLRKFLAGTPLAGYVAMKTGSMTGIQCYAGYKLDEDYAPTHVIVIIANDIHGGSDRMKRAAADMLLQIFAPGQPQ